ncbi:hypothetical protein JK635_07600 [Neobacillus sp. YIM B02564]|uniref:Uncharacterized protein n=1 Tax=Neobacillus paridis TaxID=2803862 RepID=A0ABS1TL80_9BACI|nr:hypothetical protein [Neobacillus paridis]MBL4952073.1 hypothetical protein [Neobacillus paridis]
MEAKPNGFRCENCGNETYGDREKCMKCGSENSIKPIPKDLYKCYLNGKFYGGGNLNYILELFKDYVVTCKMYGKKECDFKIVKD